MTPDKATVELVAGAIWEEIKRLERKEGFDVDLDDHQISVTQAALAALPTPTDASGLLEALEKMAVDEPLCDDYHCGSCGCHLRLAKQALAQHREGKPPADKEG